MKRILIVTAMIAAAALVLVTGLIIMRGRRSPSTQAPAGQVWTCSMHPQVRLPGPGKCPICGMDLVPAAPGTDGEVRLLQLSERALAMAAVETEEVKRRPLEKEIRAVGRVVPNEASLTAVTTRVAGYIEHLYVDATGVRVEREDHLVEIYSPELVAAQEELFIALNSTVSPRLVESVERRLLRAGLTEEQIVELKEKRVAKDRMTIVSPHAGTVIEKAVVQGSSVAVGDVLYRLADLGSVWVHLELYEYEIGWVQEGESAECTAEAWPGRVFHGTVTFVSPVLDEATRTVRVRVVLPNRDALLKPGMFVSAALRVRLRSDGRPAPTARAGRWTCPMHPEVLEDEAGECRICGMPLRQYPPAAPAAPGDLEVLTVPASAVLDLGTRRMIYVEKGRGRFLPALVDLGPRAGDWFPVMKGVAEGDRVAKRGVFLLDSEAQIQGLESLIPRQEAPGGPGKDHEGSEGSEHR